MWLIALTLAGYQGGRPAALCHPVQDCTCRSGACFAIEMENEEMDGDFEDADVPDCDVSFEARSMPGTCDPIGFFDPVGFTKNASEGRIRFYREVEVGLAKEPTPSLALPAQPWQHLLTRPCCDSCGRSSNMDAFPVRLQPFNALPIARSTRYNAPFFVLSTDLCACVAFAFASTSHCYPGRLLTHISVLAALGFPIAEQFHPLAKAQQDLTSPAHPVSPAQSVLSDS